MDGNLLLVVNSADRDRRTHPQAASFAVELDAGVDPALYGWVELAGCRVPSPYILTIREDSNTFRFSEDVMVYDRVAEERTTHGSVQTVSIPARYYASLQEVAVVLEAAINAVSTADITLRYDPATDRYTLVSSLQRKAGAPPERPALCGFHVFASPLLEMMGFLGHTDHLLVGTIPYFTQKASLTVRGALPPSIRVADKLILAMLLPSGAVHTEAAFITQLAPNSFEIDHRPAFSDHLVSVHYGILYSVTCPRRVPPSPDPLLYISLPGLAQTLCADPEAGRCSRSS
ncbi:hypothetical protein HXX76_014148 [Chlamydomonas incerta]|uniref:Uncharacterized protein n=1 Tax=Chlamydomonas incerta TaxID=51695 RepID=A0A835VRE2_CHLIN|nr:hypothetical protein HXX76_014148 [Chlamydomonas incerta]|eukprot:KAG2424990.1 hypothetical protein HXX76_014148 [Chlamydomonas incerta]